MKKIKTIEEEQIAWRRKKKLCRCFYYAVQVFALILALYLYFMINKAYGITAIAWLIWNYIQYKIGCQEMVIDEWETGYPTYGVRRMVKSWIFFVIAVYIVYRFILSV